MRIRLVVSLIGAAVLGSCTLPPLDPGPAPIEQARDPGPRAGTGSAGMPLPGLTAAELKAFEAGREDFVEVEDVKDGLGPTMNLNSCVGCHSQPAAGGSSPPRNPQVGLATLQGARNKLPPFISADGPVREARFLRNPDGTRDGGVHALFTIAGRSDAPGCSLAQPDFAAELARNNVVFRIPTPLFGGGLIEQIPDAAIIANRGVDEARKQATGVVGRPNFVLPHNTITGQGNRNGNDGTIGRFGWKAQNKSLLIFSGEAYNVEMGITNEAFPTERDETPGCQFARSPNNIGDLAADSAVEGLSAIEKFAIFMRFLAPPAPSRDTPGGAPSIERGRVAFEQVGCALCHTPALATGNSQIAALRNVRVPLYSDLLLHDMGEGLADHVSQGQASGREFRTAPLWGLGQRLFFLHDGRTNDLRQAVREHHGRGSEANAVVREFYRLPATQQQDVYNFLRSL